MVSGQKWKILVIKSDSQQSLATSDAALIVRLKINLVSNF